MLNYQKQEPSTMSVNICNNEMRWKQKRLHSEKLSKKTTYPKSAKTSYCIKYHINSISLSNKKKC